MIEEAKSQNGERGAQEKDFALERYRYVLEQKRELNKATFGIVAIYQAGLGLVAAGELAIRGALSKGELKPNDAQVMLDGVFWLLIAVTVFSLLLLFGGIAAWLGCRRDEAHFEDRFLGGARSQPKLRNVFGWYETYFVIAIVVITSGYYVLFR